MLGGVEEDIAVDEEQRLPDRSRRGRRSSSSSSRLRLAGRAPSAPATAPTSSSGGQGLHFDRIEAIQERLPGFPLVMHGSAPACRRRKCERINAAGGKLTEGATGVDEDQYLPAAKLGVTQGQHRHRRPPGLDPRPPRVLPRQAGRLRLPRPPGKIFMAEYAKFIASKNEKLGSAGKLAEVRASLGR